MTSFIKQYGEMRTGTNLIRKILTQHFADIRVLVHILGDKHSLPADFSEIYRRVREDRAAANEFTVRCTFDRPARTTREDDPEQSLHMSLLSGPIGECYAQGELLFLISIKNPYSWYASMRRFARLDGSLPPLTAAAACERFNRNYRAWIALMSQYRQRVAVVRYEDLLTDPAGVSARLEARFSLQRQTAGKILLPKEMVVPTYWDNSTTRTAEGVPFNREYYDSKAYMHDLSMRELRTLSTMIDWTQLAEFGYFPEEQR